MESNNKPGSVPNLILKAKNSTRLMFLVCGLGVSAWAPMVPYVKERLQLDEARLGFLLLFLGAGAIVTMPLTGQLIPRWGTRRLMLYAGILISVTLPLLLLMSSPAQLAFMLFLYGAGIGSIDVAMNAHGVVVQNQYGRPIMSSLHGLFSVGGLLGPVVIGLLLKTSLSMFWAAVFVSFLLMIMLFMQYPRLLSPSTEKSLAPAPLSTDEAQPGGKSAWLHPRVLFLGALCFSSFLAEGAVLDWGAVYLHESRGVGEAFAGLGYTFFSLAMAGVRLSGDGMISRFDKRIVVSLGGLLASAGFILFVLAPALWISLVGIVLVGAGAANIVPVLFSDSGRIKGVSGTAALAAVTALGYTGQLAGPAFLGFVARQTGLSVALSAVGFLLLAVSISYFMVNKPENK